MRCRLRRAAPTRLLSTWLAAAVVSSALWLLLARLVGYGLETLWPGADARLGRGAVVMFALGVLLFALSATCTT